MLLLFSTIVFAGNGNSGHPNNGNNGNGFHGNGNNGQLHSNQGHNDNPSVSISATIQAKTVNNQQVTIRPSDVPSSSIDEQQVNYPTKPIQDPRIPVKRIIYNGRQATDYDDGLFIVIER